MTLVSGAAPQPPLNSRCVDDTDRVRLVSAEPATAEETAFAELANAGYQQVTSLKNDQRYVPYFQRWQGPAGQYDWFEFPHDLPLALVWEAIHDILVNPPQFLAERHDQL